MSSAGSPPIDNPIIINIMTTWGCSVAGAFLAQSFWAISTLQVFIYYKNYENDRLSLKLLVIALWLMETVNQISLVKSAFITIVKYGSIAILVDAPIETMLSELLSPVVVFMIQIYYIHRICCFAGKKWWMVALTIIWVILAVWQVVGAIVYLILSVGKPYIIQTQPLYLNLNMAGRLAAVFVDTTLSLCMVWLLTYKYRTPLPKTREMLHRVMIVTINGGVWTAILALVMLILTKTFPQDSYYVIFVHPMCSMYMNSFLGNLNARSYIRGDGTVHTTFGLHSPAAPTATLEFRRDIGSGQGTTTSEPAHVIDKHSEVV